MSPAGFTGVSVRSVPLGSRRYGDKLVGILHGTELRVQRLLLPNDHNTYRTEALRTAVLPEDGPLVLDEQNWTSVPQTHATHASAAVSTAGGTVRQRG